MIFEEHPEECADFAAVLDLIQDDSHFLGLLSQAVSVTMERGCARASGNFQRYMRNYLADCASRQVKSPFCVLMLRHVKVCSSHWQSAQSCTLQQLSNNISLGIAGFMCTNDDRPWQIAGRHFFVPAHTSICLPSIACVNPVLKCFEQGLSWKSKGCKHLFAHNSMCGITDLKIKNINGVSYTAYTARSGLQREFLTHAGPRGCG